jgi:mitochondrial fission protein ELM1
MTTQPAFQKLAETAHSNVEQLQAYALIALDASEKLLAINFGSARSLCESVSSNPAPLAGADVQETLSKQAAAQSRNLEQFADYLRQINEVCVGAQSEFVELGSRQLEQLQQSMNTLLQDASKLNLASALDAVATAEPRSRSMRKAA